MAAPTLFPPRQPSFSTFTPTHSRRPSQPQSPPLPISSGQTTRPIRSMLDIEPVHEVIPEEHTNSEENQSTDGSDGPLEPLTPTSGDTHQFLYLKTSKHKNLPVHQPQHTSITGKPMVDVNPPTRFPPALPNPQKRPSISLSQAFTMAQSPASLANRSSSRINTAKRTSTGDVMTSPQDSRRPGFFAKTKSFLKGSNSNISKIVDQYAPVEDKPSEHKRAPSSETKSRPSFAFSTRRSSRSNSPPMPRSPSSTSNETQPEFRTRGDSLEKRNSSRSAATLNRHSQPMQAITWGPGYTDGGLTVPAPPRRRSASTEHAPGYRRPNEPVREDDDRPTTTLQASFSARAEAGVGLKARRLSLSLPDDMFVVTHELEKEYKSGNVFGGKGHVVGKGATAKVTTMIKRDGPKDEVYAVKEFREKERGEDENEYVMKIKSEYIVANSLNHPSIVRTFDLCIDKHNRYNHVMEYCEYELYALVERGLFRTHYTFADRNCFFKQILRAVDYLHCNGIAHRDIKLENILMNKDGFLKLTDFGVSEVFCGEHPGTRASGGRCGQNMSTPKRCSPGICGSLPYISPEVLSRKVEYDPTKLDTWSCAMVYLNMALGGTPWNRAAADSKDPGWVTYIQGFNKWLASHPDGEITEEANGAPNCGPAFKPEFIGNPAMKRLMFKMLHPDPEKRITVHDALTGPTMRGWDCCAPESYEDLTCEFDVSKGIKPVKGKLSKQVKHHHLPPKQHKTPKALQHRFDMGHGWY